MSRVHRITLLNPTATLRPSWNLSWEPLIFRIILRAIIHVIIIYGILVITYRGAGHIGKGRQNAL